MLKFTKLNNSSMSLEDIVGFIPTMLSEHNPKKAAEQLDDGYQHGGGWRSFKGFTLHMDEPESKWYIEYPDDPRTRVLAKAKLRDELILICENAWVVVVQPDGSYEISRMD